MEASPHILLIDDDREIRDLLARFLDRHGMRVTAARDGREARRAWPAGHYQMVILDLMLPGESGLDLARWLRGASDVPILMLTAMGDETDRIIGLELGADDYLPKPFNPRELLARIRAVLRRTTDRGGRQAAPLRTYRFAGWRLDPTRRRLQDPEGAEVPLTGGEYDMLAAMIDRANQVLTREMLLDLLRGRQAGPFDRAIDVAISRLRRKLERDGADPQLIKTVRGGGYVFACTVDRVMTVLPRSLAGRTALALVAVLVLAQAVGLTIDAMDRVDLQRIADGRELGTRIATLYRAMVAQPAETWPATLRDAEPTPGLRLSLEAASPREELAAATPDTQRLVRPYLTFGALPPALRPRITAVRGEYESRKLLLVALQAPDDRWLVARVRAPPARPWASPHFLAAFALMTATAALVALWAVRRLTAPVRVLAAAAEALGRDVNAPPLPEGGPTEVATAARAFNTMAARIRRFVADRTFLLTAIGHDLRTPITRLKLRAEWMEDDEQRRKMLADLDELEAMVAATLAFGRDVAGSEPATRLDVPALLRTVLDEAADARPGANTRLRYDGPDTLAITARPMALKRAVANLVANAIAYGGSAHVALRPPQDGMLAVLVDDEGPGIPPADLDRVFGPFQRLESSRNRETGGTGLGLPITRNILRAHGGDVTLANRAGGGLRATMTLPA